MLQGKELATAIQQAIEKRNALPGASRYGSTALGRDLGIAQSSAHELIRTGRLSKDKYLKLVDTFSDVVGPNHWGLPYTAVEHELLMAYRAAPMALQEAILDRLRNARDQAALQAKELLKDETVQKPVARSPAAQYVMDKMELAAISRSDSLHSAAEAGTFHEAREAMPDIPGPLGQADSASVSHSSLPTSQRSDTQKKPPARNRVRAPR